MKCMLLEAIPHTYFLVLEAIPYSYFLVGIKLFCTFTDLFKRLIDIELMQHTITFHDVSHFLHTV